MLPAVVSIRSWARMRLWFTMKMQTDARATIAIGLLFGGKG